MKKQENIAKIYPLTPLQEGMLFHAVKDSGSSAYCLQMSATIQGDFHLPLFEQSLNKLVENYEVLRTVFVYQNLQRPRQVVFKERKVTVPFENISHLPTKEQDEYIKAYTDQHHTFDLTKGSLMKAAIFQTGENKYRFVWAFHHIVVDGWSLGVLLHKLLTYYAALRKGEPLPREATKPYSDYIKWLDKQNKDEALTYWQNYLAGYDHQADFPKRKHLAEASRYEHIENMFTISSEKTQQLMQIANQHQATMSSVFQALWGILASKYKNTEDVVFGSVVSGRPPQIQGIESMVGLFINTIPTRVQTNKQQTFSELLQAVQKQALASAAYDYAPLYEIQSTNVLKQELIDHLVTFENYPDNSMKHLEEALGFQFTVESGEEQTSYDFNVVVALAPSNELYVKLSYNAAVYEPSFVNRVEGHLRTVIDQVIDNPQVKLSEIGIITEAEKQQLLVNYNDTAADYPRDKTIVELIAEQAARTPGKTAVVCGDDSLTYQELMERSAQLARALQARGIAKGSIVSIMAEHSLELVVAIMAVLQSGGAYLPIDPEYPLDRIQYLLDDSQTTILLTQSHLQQNIRFSGSILDLNDPALYTGDSSYLAPECQPDDLVYMIYTSGSTGNPKGAMITHQGLVNYIWWANKVYVQGEAVDFPLYSSISFDLTVTSIFTPLLSGNTIYVYKGADKVQLILDIIKDNKVGIIKLTPTHLKLIEEIDGRTSSIRRFIVGGENLPTKLAQRIYDNFGQDVRIFNEYGPTETVVGCMIYLYDPQKTTQESVPIGIPADNVQIYLLDASMQPVPVGSIGEMYIAGDGVAKGYFNRPELTAEKFIDNPFRPGTKMYRTGDLAKWLSDGNMEYVGRIDHQVKIRGHRIEMGEIETRLTQHESVKEAVVIAEKEESGQNVLYAYFVSEQELPVAELRAFLGSTLPSYMIPSYFIRLAEIPLTANGKVERKKLPKPDGAIVTGTAYVAPQNETEAKLAEIWQQVLGVSRVGVHDNFFDLGGHSLKAMSVIFQISKALEVDVPVKALFEHPTVSELAGFLKQSEKSEYSAIKPVDVQEYYPVSSAQKRMYILQQFEGEGIGYNISGAILLEGELDYARFASAIQKLAERHEALRTSFHTIDGEPVQKVHDEVEVPLFMLESSEDQAEKIMREFVRPFDLSVAPLLRTGLVKLGNERHLFLLDMHHIIADGVSSQILLREFAELYQGAELSPLPLQYKDFAVWQNEMFQTEAYKKQEQHWLGTFADEIPLLNLPTDYPRPSLQSFDGDLVLFDTGKELLERLQQVAQETGTTLYMVLLAAYNVLLSKYTGQEDIIVGTPVAGRSHADVENIMGIFVNTLALRNQPVGSKTFAQFLQEVKQNALAAYDHQDYPFEELVEKLAIQRDISRNPLFDTMFSLESEGQQSLAIGGLKVSPYELFNKISKFDLALNASESPANIQFQLTFATKLFKKETVERMAGHYLEILRAISEQPTARLADIDMMTETEKRSLLLNVNDTFVERSGAMALHQLVEEQAARTPDEAAVVYEGQVLTYRELNARANQLASLLRSRGTKPDTLIGIMVDRSPGMVVGMLAVLKAGGAYVPIDPSYPQERIQYMLSDSQAPILLTQRHLQEIAAYAGEIIDVEDEAIYTGDDSNLDSISGSDDLAYVIYTSGSTGNPKGVMISHQAICNHMLWMRETFPLTTADAVLQKTPFSFDASVWEFYLPLITGGRLVLAKPDGHRDIAYMTRTIREQKITTLQMVPSLLDLTMTDPGWSACTSLQRVFCGGEALTPALVSRFYATQQAQLINLYGPTETTIDATYWMCPRQQEYSVIPIGKPIDNIRLYVVNANNQLQPVGVAGELCIAGDGLARGYWNREELTQASFVDNPFEPGGRMYRTGDLVRYLPDGHIEYLGRIDHQVKIRGHRIELGEIEARLLQHEAIKAAVVTASQDDKGQNSLYAYVVTKQDVQASDLRAYLGSTLPAYMVPSAFVFMEQLPLSANGKVDRKALPKPEATATTAAAYVAPRNEVEAKLAEIWESVLGIEQIGVFDHFFELGGHSLKAMNVIALIQRSFQVEVPLKALFESPTIADFAPHVAAARTGKYTAIQPVEKQEYYPVSAAQKRMYILQQMEGAGISYNMPGFMYLNGKLDTERLTQALNRLVQRHESLRTSFHTVQGETVQRVHEDVELSISFAEATEEEVQQIAEQFIQPFDLGTAPLMRAGLIKLAPERHLFMLDMHHIVVDGVSIGLLIEEFARFYQGDELPELRIQYKDFAHWQNEWLQTDEFARQEAYWVNAFTGEIPVLNMPTDYPRPSVKSFEGDRFVFDSGTALPTALHQLAQETGATLYMVLLAAYNVLLAKYSGQEDIIVGAPTAGRSHAETEPIVGMFVNTLALRNKPAGDKTFHDFLAEVKNNTLQAFEHQDYPLDELVDKLNMPRDLGRNPLFDTVFILQNMEQKPFEMEQLTVTPYLAEVKQAKFDLSLEAYEENGQIVFTLDYCTKLFARETIEQLATHFIQVLREVATNPHMKLSEINMLSAEEKQRLLVAFNDTHKDFPEDKTIHALFEEQVAKTPQATAIEIGDLHLSYQELNERANQLAATLRERGVKPDQTVGIMAARSLEMVVGIMAILKAGGAYVPIDPEYPEERVAYMLADCEAHLVLTQKHLAHKLESGVNAQCLYLDDESNYSEHRANLEPIHTASNLAYVIYTSGTTGKPKGVMVEHQSIVNSLLWKKEEHRLTVGDRNMLTLSFAFDAFVLSFFSSVISGGTVVLATDGEAKDPVAIKKRIAASRCTIMTCVPSLFQAILECSTKADIQTLQVVTLGGEKITPQLIAKSKELNSSLLIVNEYGPTESSVVASYLRIPELDTAITIGRPIANTSLYIVDKFHQLQPIGVVGEICIGGRGLARGYRNKPALTAEKFVPHPFVPGERLYKTGDLGRWLPDGTIEFIGRIDEQVKVRGYRIEIGEIESALLAYEKLTAAVVVVHEDEFGQSSLCAYFTGEEQLDLAKLWSHMAKRLPSYMIPTYFVQLEQLPLTPNGKVDKKALPKPEGKPVTGAEYEAPTNPVERKLVEIWERVLGVSGIGILDNFFQMGGHSLKAMNVAAQVHREYQVELPLQVLFSQPTIKELAQYVATSGKDTYAPIQPAPLQAYYPVSSAQKRMYVLRQFTDTGTVYNMPSALYIEGDLDVERFEAAIHKLIQRHESLRTSFHTVQAEPVQRVHEHVELNVRYEELTEDQVESAIESFVQSFDLTQAPLLRVGLFKLAEKRHLFLMDMHHIISDGVSAGIIMEEFSKLYRNEELPALAVQYKDFAVWQSELFQSDVYAKQEAYWLDAFSGDIPVLNLPADFSRPLVQSFEGDCVSFQADKSLLEDLTKLAQENQSTLFMVLLAAYNVLLAKYSGQEDIVVGTPIAGRSHADVEKVLGMFVNTLALRNYPAKAKPFQAFLEEVKQNTLQAYAHQDYPFEALVEKLEIKRDLSRNPLFDTMFILQNLDKKAYELDGLKLEAYPAQAGNAKFDLTLEATEDESGIHFALVYSTKLFRRETIERMAGHFLQVLRAITKNQAAALHEISLLSEEERHLVTVAFNQTFVEYPRDSNIVELFEEQVAKTPEHTAVVMDGRSLTYRELNEKANQIAHVLRKNGIGKDSIVGLLADRSLEMIAGIMGILKAGGAYLGLDPEHPSERHSYMLEDGDVKVVLVQEHLLPLVSKDLKTIVLDGEGLHQEDTANPELINGPRDLAYVMYTSGSTGKPKGVMVEHRNVIRLVKHTNYVQVRETDRMIQTGAIGFDAMTFEIFGALLHGASLYLVSKDVLLDAEKLGSFLRANQITTMWLTSPLFNQLSQDNPAMFASLRALIVGGEALSPKHINKVRNALPELEIWNGYGPTENTTFSTCYLIDKHFEEQIPIGKPIANSTAYILDASNQPQPIGVPGELCVGGDGVARGYLNKPDLTAEKFVPNPFVPGEMMYRTGDLARWLADGTIEYLGRIDQQVKIRGYRIELGEIESVLSHLEHVKEAVVAVIREANGQNALCAYFVSEQEVDVAELREAVSRQLPAYMVPAYYMQMEKLPLTANGKVDRRALPQPSGERTTGNTYVAPQTETEAKLAQIWQDVLGLPAIGIHDNFFEIGGHSLKAMNVITQVHKTFQVELPLKVLFASPTIQEMAAFIAKSAHEQFETIQPVEPAEYYPVSFAQKRMYILHQFEGSGVSYNVPNVLVLEGKLDYGRFTAAIQTLVKRHEALRTSFHSVNGEPQQRVHADVEVPVSIIEATDEQAEALIQQLIQPFDLETAPLFRASLIKLGEERHLFFMDMHHIISDGVSLAVIVEEITNLYEGKQLAELRIQYKDFAVWQAGMAQSERFQKQEEFWAQTFAGEIPLLNLPTDYPRPSVQSFDGDMVAMGTGHELLEQLRKLAADTGTTLFMVLLAAYHVLLSKYAGQEEIVIGTPIAGRSHADVERIVGMFVNTLALKNTASGNLSFRAFLQDVKQNALNAFEHQDYPFEQLVEKLQVRRDLSRNPLFDTMFSLGLAESAGGEMAGLTLSPYPVNGNIAKFDLTLDAMETQNELLVQFSYCTKLFAKETMNRLASHYVHLLRTITADPDIRLSQISVLPEQEKEQMLHSFTATARAYPTDKTFQELFEEQVEKTPNQIAVLAGNEQLTYQELNEKANQLARVLRKKGVKPESTVGILVDRSPYMVVGMLAVLKAGGAYVPIDPDYPLERQAFMLEDSGAKLLLTLPNMSDQLAFPYETLYLDAKELSEEETGNLEHVARPEHAAYIIYTSGTTGKPKGVVIEHHSYANVAFAWKDEYHLDSFPVRLLQMASFAFDVSTGDFARALLTGGQLFICPNEVKMDPASLYEIIHRYQITIFEATPALIVPLMHYIYENKLDISQMKLLILGADSCPAEDFKTLLARFGDKMRIINSYGVTEACIDSSYYEEADISAIGSGTVPIGKPLPNMTMYVVDEQLNLQPVGVVGELCIGGAGVARGYLNRPDLTEEKFVVNPFAPGERLYRTGDLAKWRPDGNVEFLGRNDHQVKIRGVRIELGEIETQLRKLDGITEAVVVAREDHNQEKYLCAYIVADREFDSADLRAHLLQELPQTMIPSYFVSLESMPLTANGKVDRRSLPAPDVSMLRTTEYVAPRTVWEARLASVWEQVLHVPQVGVLDDFFALGGHSLRAMRVITSMHNEYQVDIPLRILFEKPTIQELAAYIEETAKGNVVSIEPAREQAYYPVSSAQKRMYILNQFEGVGISYNMPSTMLIEGKLDRNRVEAAFKGLIARHESLRTSFAVVNGEPVQKIHADVPFAMAYFEVTEDEARHLVSSLVQPFDLEVAPLIRVALLKIGEDRHVLFTDMHHSISDGVSSGILLADWVQLYQGEVLPNLRIQYKDFAVWQQAFSQSAAFQQQEAYWLQTFADDIPVLNLPTDFTRPSIQSFAGDHYNIGAGKSLTEGLNQLAQETGTTLYMVLLAAYNVLLAKYTGQEDIIVGTPITGRSHADLEPIVGMFVNTLAMRNKPAREKTFVEFLQEVKQNALDAYSHQDYPFEELVEKLAIPRDLSRNPLFDTVFTFQNGTEETIVLPDCTLVPYMTEETGKHAKFDLTLVATEEKDEITLGVEYSTSLFARETIERLGRHLLAIASIIVQNPHIRLGEIDMLSLEERQQILHEFNDTAVNYALDKTLHQLFEEQVGKTPDQAALYFDGQTLTYRELNARANQLANVLRTKGVGPDRLVAIMAERSPEMVIGILGIMKAGGAYVPVDPAYPQDRIQYLLEDSGASLLLSQAHLMPLLSSLSDKLPECLDLNATWDAKLDRSNLPVVNQPSDLAYVIYTSGTTGKPKGVMIPHQGIVNCMQWRRDEYGFRPGDKALQVFSFAFDGFVASLFAPLLGGATCVLPREEEAKDPVALKKLMATTAVTHYYGVPSLFQAIVDCSTPTDFAHLRCATLGGEKLPEQLVRKTKEKHPSVEINNEYGPTENSVVTTISRSIEPGQTITIGRPLANVQVYIVDEGHNLQPVGVVGELCIGGAGLARGYLNRPDLTAEKFVENPFQPGESMYKTGDLVKWRTDGTIEYVGRADEQVKVRGYRIEIGEIESAVLAYKGIEQAVVVAREDDAASGPYLCAYFVPAAEVSVADLRSHLAKELPAYMVPSYFVKLAQLPLSANGKVDRKALPKPQPSDATTREYVAPRNATEQQLVSIWQEVLGMEPIGITDHFFELGGHSLKATLLIAKVYEYMQVELPLNLIFQHPTVEKVADFITHKRFESQYGKAILLNEKTERNVFCFTPIGAQSVYYQKLAAEIQGISLYSFDFIQDDNRMEQYIEAITAIDPNGPYTLMGYSSGGNLAFEVAKELEQRGYAVTDIILFDSYWKDKVIERTVAETENDIARLFAEIGENTEMFNMTREDFELYAANEFVKQSFVRKTVGYVMYHNQLVNTGTTNAAIHLIKSELEAEEDAAAAAEWNESAWATATKRLLTYDGYGIHSHMLSGPYVSQNASIFRNILQELFIAK
ncbi:amino acid adenylation domain-containing protein [Brevibacillus gelatini]|uniref:Amino acid adenylation domain-containing protein n=1 Tax=Brevibacillus gelatini TaxID=1655277 RepID=A0A3M8B6C1_9BACL|nr:non-ribosomal peptide synthase/polyketide synthase [Brevibacillus gelatini]RNB58979.1 amino acid adenylation domain-containing protein [Brevibacillus gelatini]